jgi:microsomal dipeptidase-like Zn-dependent dipeptidase
MKKNGGVVQTVAFKSYLNTEKNNAYGNALSDVIKELAKKENFEILTRAEMQKMEAGERSEYRDKYRELSKKAQENIDMTKTPPVDVADFVDHIDYLAEKMGLDHVGISSDFDGGGGIYGWNDASETLNVTAELVKRGYTESQIAQLWSGNLLRVLDEVEKIAKKIQAEE